MMIPTGFTYLKTAYLQIPTNRFTDDPQAAAGHLAEQRHSAAGPGAAGAAGTAAAALSGCPPERWNSGLLKQASKLEFHQPGPAGSGPAGE
jgi:hypothetical protein